MSRRETTAARTWTRRCIARWQKKMRAIPGVTAVGYNRLIPLLNWGWNSGIEMVGKPPDPPDHERLAEVRTVSPEAGTRDGLHGCLADACPIQPSIRQRRSRSSSSTRSSWIPSCRVRSRSGSRSSGTTESNDHRGCRATAARRWSSLPLAEMDYPMSQVPLKDSADTSEARWLFVRTTLPPEAIVPSASAGPCTKLRRRSRSARRRSMDDVLADRWSSIACRDGCSASLPSSHWCWR